MSKLKTFAPWAFAYAIMFVLLSAIKALAQDPSPSPSPVPEPVDAVVQLGISVVGALVVFGTPLLILAAKNLTDQLPKFSIPILASVIGVAIQYTSTLVVGGKFAPVAAVALVGISNMLRGVLTNISTEKASKALAVLLITGVGLASTGCASTAPAKKNAYVGLAAADEALNLVVTTLLRIECGKALAPEPPACLSSDKADAAWKVVGEAGKLGKEAQTLVRALPPTIDTSTPPAEIAALFGKIWEAIWRVTALFQHDGAKALNKDLTALSRR